MAVKLDQKAPAVAPKPAPSAQKRPAAPPAPAPKVAQKPAGWSPASKASAPAPRAQAPQAQAAQGARPADPPDPVAQRQVTDLLNRMNGAHQTLSQNGAFGSKVASLLTGGAVGGAMKSVDNLVGAVNNQYYRALSKGHLTAKDARLLEMSIKGAMSSIEDVRGIRKDVINTTANVATGAGLAVATVATGGLAAPVAAAALATVGAGARAGSMVAMEGANYTTKAAVQDVALGAVQGATSVVGGSVGTGMARAASVASAKVVGQVGARVIGGVIQGAASGAVGGAVGGGAEAAVTASTWKGGAQQGLQTVARQAATGAVAGAAGGAVAGGVMNIRGKGIYDSVTRQKIEADLTRQYEAAARAHPKVEKAINEIAAATNGQPLVPKQLKGRERAMEKVLADYGGDASKITDLSRGSISFDSVGDARNALDQLQGRFEVVRVKDRFAKPGPDGYRDMLVNLKIDGHVVEVQLHHNGVLAVKNGPGHQIYEQVRGIEAAAKLQNRPVTGAELAQIESLQAQSAKLYEAAIRKGGG